MKIKQLWAFQCTPLLLSFNYLPNVTEMGDSVMVHHAKVPPFPSRLPFIFRENSTSHSLAVQRKTQIFYRLFEENWVSVLAGGQRWSRRVNFLDVLKNRFYHFIYVDKFCPTTFLMKIRTNRAEN